MVANGCQFYELDDDLCAAVDVGQIKLFENFFGSTGHQKGPDAAEVRDDKLLAIKYPNENRHMQTCLLYRVFACFCLNRTGVG